jgi:hypothetical protein
LLEEIGRAKFQLSKNQPKVKTRVGSLELHREIDIQLEEVSTLLEKFQEKVEENEAE